MIYTIFLYQSDSGLLIYDRNFQESNTGKAEIFSSFLSAMKSFVSELILEGSKELKNIELGDYTVLITGIPKIKVDLVIIADKDDIKPINKLIPKFIKFLVQYEELFLTWDGERDVFSILDNPLTTLVFNNIKRLQKSSEVRPEQALKSLWAKSKQLSEQTRERLIEERDMLIFNMENNPILTIKVVMAEKVAEISSELNDEETYVRFQNEINRLKKEINDTKFKLIFYLEKIKSTLNDAIEQLGDKPIHLGDYKNTYLNLYSFSTKLKLLKEFGWEPFKEMANKLIEKDSLSDNELSEIIKNLLTMSSNLDDYLNN